MKFNISRLKAREIEAIVRHNIPIKFLPMLYVEVRGSMVCLCI